MTIQEHNALQQEVSTWFNGVQAEITKLKGFDFDNWIELPGTTNKTIFNGSTQITETITNTGNSKKVAERVTIFNSNGTIAVTVKVFKKDGITIDRQVINTTIFNSDGSITVTTV